MKLLIVEDDLATATIMADQLTSAGHDVVGIANRAARAIRLALEHQPDLALVDLHLADGLSGMETARVLADMAVRVLFATAYSAEVGDHQSRALGCLTKPYDEVDVIAAVHICEQMAKCGTPPSRLPSSLELYARPA